MWFMEDFKDQKIEFPPKFEQYGFEGIFLKDWTVLLFVCDIWGYPFLQ